MTKSHSVFQVISYIRTGPSPQNWTITEVSKGRCAPPSDLCCSWCLRRAETSTLHRGAVCLWLVIPRNWRRQHTGVHNLHFPVLALSGILCSAGLEGEQECRGGSVMGESHTCSPHHPHLWDRKPGRKGSLVPTAGAVQTSITSQEPNRVFLLVLVPSLDSLHAGVSVLLTVHGAHFRPRADDPLPPTPLPSDFVLLDSPRDFRPWPFGSSAGQKQPKPQIPLSNPSQCLNAGLGIWHIYTLVRYSSGSS